MPEIECTWCGVGHHRSPSRIDGGPMFCSPDCYHEWMSRDTIEEPCSWCGANVRVPPSRQEGMGEYDLRNRFCDKQCESEWKSHHWTGRDHPSWDGGLIETTCEQCEGTYEVKPANMDATRFCSRDCQTEHQTVDSTEYACPVCGDSFERKAYEVKGEQAFCTRECRRTHLSDIRTGENNPMWAGGAPDYYGPSWPEARRRTIDRDGYACRRCSMSRNEHYDHFDRDLEVHHVRPVRSFADPDEAHFDANLVTLCTACHRQYEGIPLIPPHQDSTYPGELAPRVV